MKQNERKKTSPAKNHKQLRKRAEEVMRSRMGEKDPEALSGEEARRLVHELLVHQIELEMQNEELRLSQEMLEESRSKYADLYDFAPVGYFTFDREGVILEANLMGSDLLGVERARLIRKPFTAYVARESQDGFYLHRRKVLEEGERQSCELRLLRKDGTELFVELESVPAGDNTLRTAVSDITGRKRVEERYRAIFGQARDGIVVMDFENGAIVDCNPEFERQTGRRLEELRSMRIWDLRLPERVESAREKFREVRQKGEVASGDLAYLRPDGGLTPIEFVSRVVEIDGKKCILGITRDITERKKAEEALHIKESAIASSINAIVLADLEGNITYVNDCFLRLMKYRSRDEVLGKFGVELAKDEREGRRILEALRKEGAWRGEVEGKRKDGLPIILRVSTSMVKDASGKPLCIMASFEDVTERKKAEEELNRYRQRLEQMVEERTAELMKVNRQLKDEIAMREKMEDEVTKTQKLESVGILAGGIAHDFNNALTAIMNNIAAAKKMLKAEKAKGESLGTLDLATKAVRRATAMTNQLLTFARGGEPVRKSAFLRDLIKDTVDFSLKGSNVNCELAVADDLWPAHVDEGQIAQVISNLVINADQSMPEGGLIEVSAENAVVKKNDALPLKEGRYIRLTVWDRGPGIPEDHLLKIFDPYFTTKKKGSGLGLASSYSIVRKHEGLITVESRPGSGTAFFVYLPASDEEVVKDSAVDEEGLWGGRVLLMDDDEDVRDSLGMMLKLCGYEVDLVKDGTEAVKSFENAFKSGRPYDVVIADLVVRGGMGGVEAVAEMKKIEPNVKAVVASGYSNDPVMAGYEKYGFCGAVSKPYSIEELNRLLQRVIVGKCS